MRHYSQSYITSKFTLLSVSKEVIFRDEQNVLLQSATDTAYLDAVVC
jgi:hypothetical protein